MPIKQAEPVKPLVVAKEQPIAAPPVVAPIKMATPTSPMVATTVLTTPTTTVAETVTTKPLVTAPITTVIAPVTSPQLATMAEKVNRLETIVEPKIAKAVITTTSSPIKSDTVIAVAAKQPIDAKLVPTALMPTQLPPKSTTTVTVVPVVSLSSGQATPMGTISQPTQNLVNASSPVASVATTNTTSVKVTSPLQNATANIFAQQPAQPAIQPSSAPPSATPLRITSLQKATLDLFSVKTQGGAQRRALLGFSANDQQVASFNARYKYDASKLPVVPRLIGQARINPIITINNGGIDLFSNPQDKRLVEEYMAYHTNHAKVFGNYVKRILVHNNGQSVAPTVDAAIINELSTDLASTPVLSSKSSDIQDSYLYIISRLTDADQMKFWNWVNQVRVGDTVSVPEWIRLVDVIESP